MIIIRRSDPSLFLADRHLKFKNLYQTKGHSWLSRLWHSSNDDIINTFEESLDRFRLNQRISSMNAKLNVKLNLLPPNNPYFNAEEFITTILQNLQRPNPSFPLLGYHVLYHSSSKKWKQVLLQSAAASAPDIVSQLEQDDCSNISSLRVEEGIPNYYKMDRNLKEDSKMDLFLHALKNAMSRPKNQFEILTKENVYRLYFPGNMVDYEDGKCWVEVHLRHIKTDELLVILGWSLIRMNYDTLESSSELSLSSKTFDSTTHSWLLDWLDWQDFRNDFRPGIGREEWERICG